MKKKQKKKNIRIKFVSVLLILSTVLCSCSTKNIVDNTTMLLTNGTTKIAGNVQTLSNSITYSNENNLEPISQEDIKVVGDNIAAVTQDNTYIFETVEKDGYNIVNMYNADGELAQQSSIKLDTHEITELKFDTQMSTDEVSESQLQEVMEEISENPKEELDINEADSIKTFDGDKYISLYDEEEENLQNDELTNENQECIHESENILKEDTEYSSTAAEHQGNIQLGCVTYSDSIEGSIRNTSSKTSSEYLKNEPMLTNSGLTKNSSLDGYYYLGRVKYNGHYGYVSRKVYTSDMKSAKKYDLKAGIAATTAINIIIALTSTTVKAAAIVRILTEVILDGVVISYITGTTGYKTKHYIYKVQVDEKSKVWYYYCRSRNYWYIAAYDTKKKKNTETTEYWKTNHQLSGTNIDNIMYAIDWCYAKNKVVDATC